MIVLPQLPPKSPFLSVEESFKASNNHSSVSDMALESDDDVTNMVPVLVPRARSVYLNAYTHLQTHVHVHVHVPCLL